MEDKNLETTNDEPKKKAGLTKQEKIAGIVIGLMLLVLCIAGVATFANGGFNHSSNNNSQSDSSYGKPHSNNNKTTTTAVEIADNITSDASVSDTAEVTEEIQESQEVTEEPSAIEPSADETAETEAQTEVRETEKEDGAQSTAEPSVVPTTAAPSIEQTTAKPTTAAPTTASAAPSTAAPTVAPTTAKPTVAPTTVAPTTAKPTVAPTTAKPTTAAPTTAKPTTTAAPALSAPVGTPYGIHGKLTVVGTNITDKNGDIYQLKGVSTHGIAWFPSYVNKAAFTTMRDEWGISVVRLAMYPHEYGGYCSGGNKEDLKKLVSNGVQYATELGLYVIIDWHVLQEKDPTVYQSQAIEFFSEMSAKYANYDNIIYEICNEPNGGVSWATIKAYAEKIIPVIRANDKDAIIVVGTPNWSQYVNEAVANPIKNYNNIMYTLHFYAATHKDALRTTLLQAIASGLPVFVTEYGITDASGNGALDEASANTWMALLDQYHISSCIWSLCNKNESSALLQSSCQKTSGWTMNDLSGEGRWFVNMMKSYAYRTNSSGQSGQVPATPTTAQTTTAKPTTQAPTTAKPTTAAPTTQAPTTQAPTTAKPTTAAPTTQAPTTAKPTTAAPTTQAPTTQPTTTAPETTVPQETQISFDNKDNQAQINVNAGGVDFTANNNNCWFSDGTYNRQFDISLNTNGADITGKTITLTFTDNILEAYMWCVDQSTFKINANTVSFKVEGQYTNSLGGNFKSTGNFVLSSITIQ